MGHDDLEIGSIEMITGPMFAGKSEELLRRINRLKYARKKFLVFKPQIDNRYSETEVVSHSKRSSKAIAISKGEEIYKYFTDDIDVLSYNYSNLLNSHNGLAFHVDDLEAEHEQFVNDISSLNENNTLLSNSLTNVSSISNQNSNEIETIKQDIQLIKSQLENLSGGSGLDYDVLYDMRSDDAAINHGVTSGAVGGTTLMIDLTPYRYLRVFGYVNSYECQDFIKLTDRNRTDFTMMSIATNMKTLNFLKYVIPATMDRIQFSNFATYTYNSAKLSFGSYELGKTNENFYAYRIEGIK